jgi:hypothetical protein
MYLSKDSGEDSKVISNAGMIHNNSRSPEIVPIAPIYGFIRLRILDIDETYLDRLNLKSKATVDEVTFIRSDI